MAVLERNDVRLDQVQQLLRAGALATRLLASLIGPLHLTG
jgi:hypothetical protein